MKRLQSFSYDFSAWFLTESPFMSLAVSNKTQRERDRACGSRRACMRSEREKDAKWVAMARRWPQAYAWSVVRWLTFAYVAKNRRDPNASTFSSHLISMGCDPASCLVVDVESVNWGLYLNTLFWNLNYWDSSSTLAGEVDNPSKALPKALFYALILVVSGYFFPLLIASGAVPLRREKWSDGYFSEIAKTLGGVWLRTWIQGASAVSNMGMFMAEMSSDSFQLLGMGERGMLPAFFAKRSRYGKPISGILFSVSGVILLSWLRFEEIVAAENYLYCFGMIMEFVAFVKLRMKYPTASWPYRILVGTAGAVVMCIPPTVLILVVLAVAPLKIMGLSLAAAVIGLVLYPCLKYAERKR